MKIVVQKVKYAKCIVDNELISEIEEGFLIFFGACNTDTISNVEYVAKKIANLRIYPNELGKLDKSIIDLNHKILNISQFTLYGDVKKGNRPSFTDAMLPSQAEVLYHELTNILINTYKIDVKEGKFGADMKIELLNDGPMTIIIEN